MIINASSIAGLFTGFKAVFNTAFGAVETHYKNISMVVPSEAKEETYAWLGNWPSIRQWIGDRVIQNLATHSWTIRNLDFENTVAVRRNDIADDLYGVYSPFFSEMGRVVAQHPDELIFELLSIGFEERCYDGQYFFDTDHPVIDANEEVQSVSNFGGGSGTAWYLLDTSRMVKPLVFQERERYQFESMTKPDDTNVFMQNQFIFGIRARVNVGYGLWQLAYGSRQPLTAENYETARAAMMSFTGDHGRKLNVRPTVLVVPNSLEGAARRLLNNDTRVDDSGETSLTVGNEWKGTASLIVSPYL